MCGLNWPSHIIGKVSYQKLFHFIITEFYLMLNPDSWILAFTDSAVMTNIRKTEGGHPILLRDFIFYFAVSNSTSIFTRFKNGNFFAY